MDRQYVFIVTPTAPLSPNVAIAGSRAGALGVLDLSFQSPEENSARRALAELQQQADRFGVKLDYAAEAWLAELDAFSRLDTLLLSSSAWSNSDILAAACGSGRQVWLELTSLDFIDQAIAAQPAGIILKGHESGGAIGDETAFVLLQRWWDALGDGPGSELPVVVQGGIGPNTAAGCAAGGATGVVLDSQLLLTRESPLDAGQRQWLTAADGSESQVVGAELGWPIRFMAPPRCAAIETLQEQADRLREQDPQQRDRTAWLDVVREAIAAGALPWGQDAALASDLIRPHRTVGGVVESIVNQVRAGLIAAAEHEPLSPGAPMAQSHGTEFPILQGPMTRVSDVAPFADSVADAGALPFLALALLRGPQVEELLQETKERLEDRPWGVGLLGFLPPEIRKEQMEAVSLHRPPYALIAGGRPDQARALEVQGIPTYLHVPSPGLLKMFLKDGARRFVFEGRECGGHVGPRSSFVLWETMCRILLDHLATPKGRGDAKDLHLVFAGGIHDARSAAIVATMAAPLAAAGCKIGGLMGTAYLFTKEAVDSGAIVSKFQKEAIATQRTVLLETGPGHAVRCIPTPYFDVFEEEKQRLRAAGKTHEEIVKALEWMNIGRLRVASKGLDRVEDAAGRRLATVSEQEQFDRGMYMIGQVSAMHRQVITMRDLHERVCGGAHTRIEAAQPDPLPAPTPSPCDIAIVGMASNYPGSTNLEDYWENILNSVYAVTEVPEGHWDWRLFYDPDPTAPDRIVSKWGGFLSDVVFDPFRYGITPKSIPSIEPLQLLLLEAVRLALDDAGYAEREFDREHTCAVLGVGGGGSPLGVMYGLRSSMPLLNTIKGLPTTGEQVIELAADQLPEWTEDSFPGFLLNVAVGRTANRFNFGGSNYAVDAACASSLAAVHACVRELEMGTANVAVALGADTVNTPYSFVAFSKTHALSPRGRCRPFDEEADGIVLSEGIGAVILKRLEDAERDGDEIYAVIRGVGSSSDGKEKGLTAPNAVGQLRALRRAYEKAGVSPASVELIEAHGTGTVVGDQTEATSLTTVMREAGADSQSCALGSVKSMIGHSKCAAGIAGLIKTAKALYHRTLPPTMVETPNKRADFRNSALYLNTEPRPWIHDTETPRVAGVSAFGFGGTNVHVAMEEYVDGYLDEPPPALRNRPVELLVWRANDVEKLGQAIDTVQKKLNAGAKPDLAEFAASLWRVCPRDPSLPTVSIIAESLEDLVTKLKTVQQAISDGSETLADPRGVYFAAKPDTAAKAAFLFPGQGSQYPNMLADAAMNFHEVRQALDHACTELKDAWDRPLSRWLYPPSTFTDEDVKSQAADLAATDVAQPAIGAASIGMLRLLRTFGVKADCYAGHSYGEWTALCAAGAVSESDLFQLSLRRGQLMKQAAEQGATGGMMALTTDAASARSLLESLENVWVANLNSPRQTVVSGTEASLAKVQQRAKEAKVKAQPLTVACAFHSPLVEAAAQPLSDAIRKTHWLPPADPVYSNVTASPYPESVEQLQEQLSGHMRSSVRFVEQIEAMYDAGVRTFVEVGPNQVLTGLVSRILGDRPHLATATDSKSRRSLIQLPHVLAQLLTHGVDVELDPLFLRRQLRTFDVKKLERETGEVQHPASAWIVNGTRNRPLNGPEPHLLGTQPPNADGTRGPQTSSAAQGSTSPRASEKTSNVSHATTPAPVKATSAKEPAKAAPAKAAAAKPVAKSSPTPAKASQAPQPSSVSAVAASAPVARPPQPAAAATVNPTPPPAPQSNQSGMKNQESKRLEVQSPSHGNAEDTAQVMLGFQDVMARFLDTQRSVMAAYLGGNAAPPPPGIPRVAQPAASLPAAPAPSATSAPPTSAPPTSAPPSADAGTAAGSSAPSNGQAGHGVSSNGSTGNGARGRVAQFPSADSAGPKIESIDEVAKARVETAPAEASSTIPVDSMEAPAAESNAGDDNDKSMDEIVDDLLELVSERTGYPKDMLDLDLDLEADLGIDSIKRVEILGGLAESLGEAPQEDGEYEGRLELEKLTAIRTLRGILEYLEETLFSEDAPATTTSTAPQVVGADADEDASVQRGLIELIASPISAGSPMIPRGAVLITDDGQGVARELSDRMTDFGQRVVLLRHKDGGKVQWEGDVCTADLGCADAVTQLIDDARERKNSIAGLVHASPLASGDDVRQRLFDVRSLYLLARTLENDLTQSATQGGAFLLACASIDGRLGFGEDELSSTAAACHGGIFGLLKSVIQEWPEVLVRAVDFEPNGDPADRAERLLSELGEREGPAEVGWSGGVRRTWQPIASDLDRSEVHNPLPAGGVVLVTGGARGITAAISRELAERCHPQLVVVGRSPLPEEEAEETRGLEAPAELKSAIMQQLKSEGVTVAPAEVETRYKQLLRDREILTNLASLRDAGAEVEYHSADVRDRQAMTELINDIVARKGGIDGVLHGAGVIEDKLLRDKTPESYERVVGTKADSAFILADLLDPDRLQFCVFFSSIAGRYGNKGQSDYAAANEMLSKLAIDLDRRWPARVLAVDWGPWGGIGMVADLEKHMKARGVTLITPDIGAEFLLDELEYGRKGESEVIIAGGASNLHSPQAATA